MKITPIIKEYIWGTETWLCPNSDAAGCTNIQFPLCKILDAHSDLSIQVHPDKDEMWTVLEAKENAEIYIGFNCVLSKSEIKKHAEDGTLFSVMNKIHVKAMDSFFIPRGTVHALCGGTKVMEVATCEGTTLRLYDYGRGRDLQMAESLECLNLNL